MAVKITKENAAEFLTAALVRAVKTMAQTAAAMLSPALTGASVDLKYVAMISVMAGAYSLATSLAAGLPEVGVNGSMAIDDGKEGDPDGGRS